MSLTPIVMSVVFGILYALILNWFIRKVGDRVKYYHWTLVGSSIVGLVGGSLITVVLFNTAISTVILYAVVQFITMLTCLILMNPTLR